jgi:general secretion pathway protein L
MTPALTSRARLLFAGRGLRSFLAWWGAGLAAWLPASWRQALAASSDRLLLQPVGGDELQLWRQGHDGLREVARLPIPQAQGDRRDPLAAVLGDAGTQLPRWLLLPATDGLRRPLVLPAAAGDRLHDVLGFEIERQTPFQPADVVYAGRVLGVRDDGQLDVELVVVPRARFDAVLARIGALSAVLAGVDVADAAGQPLGANVLPPALRQRPARPWRRWNLGLAVVAALMLMLGLGQILDNRRTAADAFQREVAQRGAQARAVARQRQRLVDAVEGAAYLQAQRNDRPSAAEVMDELARRLPDGTYLEKLSMEGDQLTLIGLSNQAAALVGKLEGARQWHAPALTGALQQDPRTRSDRFTLFAQMEGNKAAEGRPSAAR